jgi:hypothetical protein
MHINDAIKILGISGQYNPEIVKTAYRKACSLYHPDRNPAGLEMMKLVNLAYEALQECTGEAIDTEGTQRYGDDINAALNAIMGLGFDIEICGAWIWLHGDTRPHKDIIKEAGFMWAPKKKLWYFRPADYKSRGRGKFSMDEIRAAHGSQKVTEKERNKLRAA